MTEDERRPVMPQATGTDKPRNPYSDRLPGTGDHTGRCWKCGSSNLWDDNLSYGCNDCGMIRIG